MKPAEFRAIREFIGASQSDIASGLYVQTRAVKRWENGLNQIPQEAEDYLKSLEQAFEFAVDYMRDRMEEDGIDEWRIYRTANEYKGKEKVLNLPFFGMWNKAVTLASYMEDQDTKWRYYNG
jgi:transcriptional regulator with XRE-family HTH domain